MIILLYYYIIIADFLSACMQGCDNLSSQYIKNVNITTLRAMAVHRAAQGLIDPLQHITHGRYYLYRGNPKP